MKIQTPPGMRDFYPEDMRLQNWLFDRWRSASRAFGFSEYEGPIFEFLDLYTLKSGEEIVKQLFHVRHGQAEDAKFAIRPEMTPTLARMVAARAGALPRPIKWFSIPRMCRSERQQRGRLREFFQWNVDILGVEDPLADAEVIAVAVSFLRSIGLTPDEALMRVSSRPLARAVLAGLGITDERSAAAFALIDRSDKLDAAEFHKQWQAEYPSGPDAGEVGRLLGGGNLEECAAIAARAGDAGAKAATDLQDFWKNLDGLGVAPYCVFDLRVVRGLAYYTGVVFELSAKRGGLRALAGGGRYDDLTTLLDGPRVTGVGFGAGDAPMIEFLRELNRLPNLAETLDAYVIDAAPEFFPSALRIAGDLRQAGVCCDFSYKRQPIGKQLKSASGRGARYAIIVDAKSGDGDLANASGAARTVEVKNLASGTQQSVALTALLAAIRSPRP